MVTSPSIKQLGLSTDVLGLYCFTVERDEKDGGCEAESGSKATKFCLQNGSILVVHFIFYELSDVGDQVTCGRVPSTTQEKITIIWRFIC